MREHFSTIWSRAQNSAMFYGALSTFFRVGANILILPAVLLMLTGTELALWWVFIALGGIANLADFGFGQPITRVYSHFWAGADDFEAEGLGPPISGNEPNIKRLRQFHVTVKWLYRTLAIAVLIILSSAGTWFIASSTDPISEPEKFWAVWFCYIAVVGYGFGTSYWSLACQGVNRVRELQAASLWSGLAYVVSGAALLLAGWGLFAMVAATAVRSLINRQLCRKTYQKIIPQASGEPRKPEFALLKKLWPNA